MFDEKDLIVEAKHVTKKFPASKGRELVANNDINLKFYRGKTLGLVGESGCGKSTFMRMLLSLDEPTEGEILFNGQDITKLKGEKLRLNRQHIQMVFQDPATSFNPKMKIKDIICEPLLNFDRIKASEKDKKAAELLEMVELPAELKDRYMHNMSGGQRQRVAIARAIALEPDMIVMDEATSALDVSVQKTIVQLITKLQKEKNIAIGFICHDLGLAQSFSHQIAVMYLGNIVETMPGEKIGECYHPYTKALLASVFDIKMDFSKKIEQIKGEVPSPLDAPKGCPFCDRCECCMDKCKETKPKLVEVAPEHLVACHMFDKEGCCNPAEKPADEAEKGCDFAHEDDVQTTGKGCDFAHEEDVPAEAKGE